MVIKNIQVFNMITIWGFVLLGTLLDTVDAGDPKFRKEFAIPIAVVLITLSIVVVVVLLVYHFRRKRRNKQTQPSGNAVNHSKYKIDDMAKPKQNVGIVPDSSKTYPTYEIASLNTTAPPVGTPPPVYNIPVVGGRPITPRNPTMPPLPPQQNQ